MTIPKDLAELWQTGKAARSRLDSALAKLNAVDADADARFAELLADPVFKRHPEAHKRTVRQDLAREILATLEPAAGVLLYLAETTRPKLERELTTFKARAVRPPDPETAWL